ncbi:cytochrome C biogenesis protein [Candidatus Wolfebacteria bacterium]|nr:MAG: cytochrome C biogenesis protein [Candidatus Wolfebacteria bacterium]
MEISLAFTFSALVAGLFTFLAPCTLPLVPAYLGFISGVPEKDLSNPATARIARRKIMLNGIFFVLGFSAVFIIFGTLAGLLGQALVPYRLWLTRIGGAFVIIFGLYMLDILKLPIFKGKNLAVPKWLELGKPSSSFVIGSTFAFGWTPCVGPILASILLLASTSTTAFQGAFLLAVFSLGLAIPFLLVAFAFGKATQYIKNIEKYLNAINIIGGIFLVILGILLVTGQFNLLIIYGFELLRFFNYEAIYEFL